MRYVTSDKRFTVENDTINEKSFIFLCEFHGSLLSRQQLTELRSIIDQALNISSEELGVEK